MSHDWKQRKLGTLAKFSKGKGYTKGDLIEDGVPIILYGRLYTKYQTIISDIDTYVDALENSVLSEGSEVIVPSSGETSEDIARAAVVDNKGVILGGDLNIIKPSKKLESSFLALTISNGEAQKELMKKAQGNSVVHLYNNDLKEVKLFYPDNLEQTKIGNFFKTLDDTITLHQRQLDNLKLAKKSYLQKMFPKKDEKVPELRFPGFTDDWEQRKLGEISPLRGGAAFKSHLFKKEGVPIVRISNILENGFVGGEFAYYQQQENDEKYILPNQAIVLAMSGATTGKVSVLNNPDNKKVYQNQRVGYFLPTKTCDYKFISILVRTTLFHKQLESVLVAGAQPNISSKEVESFIFMIPSLLNEQRKIGTFFKQLDDTIALHQQQLDTLKEMKKGLLQKMFV